VGRETTPAEFLRVEDDDVALVDVARDTRWHRDEAISGRECGLHAPRGDVAEEYRLSENLAEEHRHEHEESDPLDETRQTHGPGSSPVCPRNSVRRIQ